MVHNASRATSNRLGNARYLQSALFIIASMTACRHSKVAMEIATSLILTLCIVHNSKVGMINAVGNAT